MLLAEANNPELPNNEDFGPDEFQLSQATGVPVIETEGVIIETKKTEIEKLKNEQKNIKREDVNINIQINEKGSKDYPDGHSIGASFNFPDLRETLREITFKRENRNSVQNSVVEKENIGNEKIKFYNFGRFNPDFTNDPGVFGFSINFKDNTIELSKNQINKINDLIQDITDNYAKLGNRYTLEGFPNASEKRQQLRDFIYQGIVDIINNKDEILKLEQEISPIKEPTLSEFEIEPTAEESTKAQSVFGNKPVLNPQTQLITGQASETDFETSSNNVLQGFEDEADSNIVSLNKVTYVKYNISYDEENNKQYVVSIFNNQELNKKFDKVLSEEEVEKLFKDNGLFFSSKNIKSNDVYVLKDINKKPINSFQQDNIISKITIPESSILNSVYANDLTNQEGEIVVLDTENKYNNTLKTEEDFRNNATLGVVVNNALVAIIPANKGNTRNAQVRNKLTITKVGNTFTVQPFKVKIKKVKKDAFLFNNQPIRINEFLNQIDGFTSTVAFVYETDKVKKLVNPLVKREVSELNIPADNLTNNGVYLILERSGENPIIIPLQSPKLKEFFSGTLEDLQNIKTIFKANISDVFESRDLKANYNIFLDRLKTASDKNPVISQIVKVIPTSINEMSTNTSQKIKLENLKLNFNLDNIMDYLWDTLITLNENTKEFYSVDLNPANFYANNSVIIDYDKNIIMDTKNNNITSNTIFNQDNDVYC